MESEILNLLKTLDADLKTALANQEQIYLLLREIKEGQNHPQNGQRTEKPE